MMHNLFSSFDSKNFMFSSPLMLNLFIMFMLNKMFMNSKMNIYMKKMNIFLNLNINKNIIMKTIFMMIFYLNIMGLNIYSFNLTSQISFNLITIISMWTPILLLSLTKKNNFFLSHLVPFGTSIMLIPMMVLIELISFFIRPLTLILRLTINMISGHVLISLMSTMVLINSMTYLTIIYLYMMMKFLVSLIQAYIISTLLNLYIEEI